MHDLLRRVFASDEFMPHGECFLWRPGLLWLHVVSDALIGAAYLAIAGMIVRLVRRISLPFSLMILAFGTFIGACGLTHLLDVLTLWVPDYWLSGSVKAITAVASVSTAGYLFRLQPTILRVAEDARGAEARQRDLEAATRRLTALTGTLDQRVAERTAALHRSERKLALHLEQTLLAVIEFDTEFRVVYWNPAAERIFGWTREAALGRHAADLLVPPGARAKVDATWRALLTREGGHYSLNENVTRDGRAIKCEWFNTVLGDGLGQVSGVMSLAMDVTERERREEVQGRVQRLESLSVLAGGIAHDFNNMLTGILGNLSLVLADDPPAAERAELLRETEAAARRAQGLTRQLLTFSRGGAPVRVLIDLSATVREAALFASRGAASACRFEAPADLWAVEADPGQVAQVVQNLTINAREAMPAGGTVDLSLSNVQLDAGIGTLRPGPYVRLRVADQGVGIPADRLSRIFDPFFSTKGRGTGLGLAVCHSIVMRHGGHVEARSEPGRGSTFDVFLPAQPGAQVEPAREVPPRDASNRPGRVLVMDDEEAVRRVAQRVLAAMDCDVESVPDGAAAVARWREARAAGRPFDLVILDLTVAGGAGGAEALARLRAEDPDVLAVVSSGYSTGPVMANHRAFGFAAALPKPWSAEELRAVVGQLLAAGGSGPARR
jgi:PAS domain S-box-containing protein